MEHKHKRGRIIRHILSFPFIWMMLLPIAALDVLLEIYHNICFPLYGVKKIKRKEYVRIDRHKLSYLSLTDKINCMYCGYANGLLHYASVIAGETEKYWCGIRHRREGFIEPAHHKDFLEYGDEKAYTNTYGKN